MKHGYVFIISALLSIFSPSLLFGMSGNKITGSVYELSSASKYKEGCVSPCTCPLRIAELSGTFKLVRGNTNPDFTEFNLEEISWSVNTYNGRTVHKITGAGIYQMSNKMNRLILDISIDGEKEHFDSGSVPVRNEFPAIKMMIDRGSKCLNTWLNIDAYPRK
jgi:hypothetical protein